ncbi:MAG: ImmA/IrrE family metallo-endopeptidase [Lentimicrobiaceae bacterium]|jgi:Zn-dependent peptidase ImmA (M78 family)
MSSPKVSAKRKAELEELAEMIACDYADSGYINLEMIAQNYGIKYSLNDYNSDFKGLIEFSENSFHIYLDKAQGKNLRSHGVRYSFAHELGHFLINEHRSALMTQGMFERNPQRKLDLSDQFEKEAEFFASCLLMPRELLLNDLEGSEFNFDLMLHLSRKYNVSFTAVLLRYQLLGTTPISLVMSHNRKYLWHRTSKLFPFYSLNLEDGELVPKGSLASTHFEGTDVSKTTVRLPVNTWFHPRDHNDTQRFFNEMCITQLALNQVVSVIWED